MPGPLARSALFLTVPVAAVLAVAGGLALRAPGLVTLLVTAAVVGATTALMVEETPGRGRAAALDAGARAAAWTAGVLLVWAGLATVAGGSVAVLVGGAVAVAVVAVRLRRVRRPRGPALRAIPASRPVAPERARPARIDGPTLLMPSVGGMTARALGEEWLRSTALMDARLDAVVRRSLVARRQSVLDELERRDPVGFARWLAHGPGPGSDPAEHVRDLPAAGPAAA